MWWCVYIISNNAHTLYVGITNDIRRRFEEHKNGLYENSFTARYTWDRVVYIEHVSSETIAKRREKQIKGWRRSKKDRVDSARQSELDSRQPHIRGTAARGLNSCVGCSVDPSLRSGLRAGDAALHQRA
jgi:putative endonuclease